MGSSPTQQVALAVIAVSLAVGVFFLFRGMPRTAVAVWVAVMFFTPVWLGATVQGFNITALIAVTLIAMLAWSASGLHWSFVDSLVLILAVAVALAVVIGGSDPAHAQEFVLMWMLPYAWGRLILARVSREFLAACIAIAAAIAAVLAIAEFLTGDNIFLSIPGASSSVWGGQRQRAGLIRVEGAFGHSIALGGSLAMSIVFVMVLKWAVWLRTALIVLLGTAAALTFSRLGLVGVALTIALMVVLLHRVIGKALSVTISIALGVGAVAALPTLLQVFGDAGAEAEGSAEYRGDLLPLVNTMNVLGVSPARERLPTGEDYWGGFRSIDSALILLGLQFGLIPLALSLVLIGVLIVATLRRPSPPAIALLAQVPAFATVALITQYSAFTWFVAGLAVAWRGAEGDDSVGRGRGGSVAAEHGDRALRGGHPPLAAAETSPR